MGDALNLEASCMGNVFSISFSSQQPTLTQNASHVPCLSAILLSVSHIIEQGYGDSSNLEVIDMNSLQIVVGDKKGSWIMLP